METLINIPSRFDPRETMDWFEREVRARGMEVFARIDHAAGAVKAGLELRPTEVIFFGNTRAGTPLMQANQTIGLDLPLKALVWQDASGATWVSYQKPAVLAQRHGLGSEMDRIVEVMQATLDAVSRNAATGH